MPQKTVIFFFPYHISGENHYHLAPKYLGLLSFPAIVFQSAKSLQQWYLITGIPCVCVCLCVLLCVYLLAFPISTLISVFYCFITYYHKLSGLKQHIFTISQFLWVQNLDTAYLGHLPRVSQGCNSCVILGCGLIWGLAREESAFVGRLVPCGYRTEGVSFLLAVGWRSPLASDHMGLPTQAPHTWQIVPLKLARKLVFSHSLSFFVNVTSVFHLLSLSGKTEVGRTQKLQEVAKPPMVILE